MSLRSLPGLVSGSPRWSIIGSEGSLLNIMVLLSWSLAGPFTDRAAVGRFHPQINFLMPHSVTTRIPVADIADYEHTSALRRNLDQLSNRSGSLQSPVEDVGGPEVSCLCHEALFKWHLGEVASYQATIEEAISFMNEVNDMHGLAISLH